MQTNAAVAEPMVEKMKKKICGDRTFGRFRKTNEFQSA